MQFEPGSAGNRNRCGWKARLTGCSPLMGRVGRGAPGGCGAWQGVTG